MTEQTSERLDTVTWWEIPVVDLDAAQTFYGAVFGWTFTPFGDGVVGAHTADGALVGGLLEHDGPTADGVRIYLNVADIEVTLARVEATGGADLLEASGGRGRHGLVGIAHRPARSAHRPLLRTGGRPDRGMTRRTGQPTIVALNVVLGKVVPLSSWDSGRV